MYKIIVEYDTPVATIAPDKWANDAATAIANGKRVSGHEKKSHGSFSTAYLKGFLVVKGVKVGDDPQDTPVGNYLTWLDNVQVAMRNKHFREIANKYIAPCTILNKTVIVQDRVVVTAAELDVTDDLLFAVENLGMALGILDMHEENWGFDVHGQIKMFDLMPMDSPDIDETELRNAVKAVEKAMKNWLSGKASPRDKDDSACDCRYCRGRSKYTYNT